MSHSSGGSGRQSAETDPTSGDGRLRGRTYAIPFDTVWQAALELAQGGVRGWTVLRSDDRAGVILAVVRTLVRKREDDVRIDVRLDENAQTRVDVRSTPRSGKNAGSRNRGLIGRFLKRLDRKLDVRPGQILDPTATPTWRLDGN